MKPRHVDNLGNADIMSIQKAYDDMVITENGSNLLIDDHEGNLPILDKINTTHGN